MIRGIDTCLGPPFVVCPAAARPTAETATSQTLNDCVNIGHAEFILGSIQRDLHFLSFLNTEMARAV